VARPALALVLVPPFFCPRFGCVLFLGPFCTSFFFFAFLKPPPQLRTGLLVGLFFGLCDPSFPGLPRRLSGIALSSVGNRFLQFVTSRVFFFLPYCLFPLPGNFPAIPSHRRVFFSPLFAWTPRGPLPVQRSVFCGPGFRRLVPPTGPPFAPQNSDFFHISLG